MSAVIHMSLGGQHSPLANGQVKSHLQHLQSCTGVWVGKTLPFANGQEKSRLHDLESCTRVCMGKTPPLLKDRRKVVCTIYNHALEFRWVRLSHC